MLASRMKFDLITYSRRMYTKSLIVIHDFIVANYVVKNTIIDCIILLCNNYNNINLCNRYDN